MSCPKVGTLECRLTGVFKDFHNDDPISRNSRIYKALDMIGLWSRLIGFEGFPKAFFQEEIDYQVVQSRGGLERDKSLRYLDHAIKSAFKQ